VAEQRTFRQLGADLALTGYVGTPSTVELTTANSWGELDLRVTPGGQGGLRLAGDVHDLAIVSGRENLAQALMLRLLTSQGALESLGHPSFGSRLPSLIGRLNNEQTRNLARLYTIEAIGQEPRVRELRDLQVETIAAQPDTIRIAFSVVPLGDDDPLALALEVTL
jgi:phage baseplate assembly protein W